MTSRQVRSVTADETAQQQITHPAAARSLVLTEPGIRTHRRILSHGRSLEEASYMASCDCCRTARHEPRPPLGSRGPYSRVVANSSNLTGGPEKPSLLPRASRSRSRAPDQVHFAAVYARPCASVQCPLRTLPQLLVICNWSRLRSHADAAAPGSLLVTLPHPGIPNC